MSGRPETPAPLLRRGPRPLLLHLMLAMLRSNVSTGASPLWNADWPILNAATLLQQVQAAIRGADHLHEFPAAVFEEVVRQDAALIAGIAAYRRHPWQRRLSDPPAVWTEGETRLLDYGPITGRPLLVVPSLVNRAYVLDLMEGHSMLRWLAEQGVRPLLLDWGWPTQRERRFTMTDYVAGRLERAMTAAVEITRQPPVLAGYCMGGTLAVAAAQRRPDLISGLICLATPWDFHQPEAGRAKQAADLLPVLEPILSAGGSLPVDVLQSLFVFSDPWDVARKYRSFAQLPQDSARASLFVALEDWLNDGVPLGADIARTCLRDWYGANLPASGDWAIAGMSVDPGAIRQPTWVAIPNRDRIVPPESARALAERIAGATLHRPAAGHIGMVAGMQAKAVLWQPMLQWLGTLPAGRRITPRRKAL
jgi:polyhydroxyalkanoate synthase subunit PhaC